MKLSFDKKIYTLSLGLSLWQFFILPIKSFAVTSITYTPLETEAFGNTLTSSTDLGTFLSQAFNYGLGIAAALAVVMIVWGGVEIMLSESVFNKDDGKKKIKDALTGLLLALVSWLILYIINPEILNFKL